MIESRSDKLFRFFSHAIMIILSLAAILPMILLLTSSFTDNDTLILNGYTFFPKEWSLDNYKYILDNGEKIFRAYGVSIALTVCGTLIGTSMTMMMGYALSRPELPGRKFFMVAIIITMLFNGGLVPSYLVYTNTLHVKNTFLGLLLPSLLMSGFNVMLVKSYFTTSVPNEILEAAELDGATEFQKFTHVALPMGIPIIATIALFTAMGYWNDWNNGYVYISTNTDLYSIQNLLNRMQQNMQFLIQNSTNIASANSEINALPTEGIRMAISVLGILPVLIVYPWMQKFFIKGINVGGIKG